MYVESEDAKNKNTSTLFATVFSQENHDLICDMAREEGTEAAALPKLLLDLIEQVEGSKTSQKHGDEGNGAEAETEKKEDDLQQEDIAHNLPKVRLSKSKFKRLTSFLHCLPNGYFLFSFPF